MPCTSACRPSPRSRRRPKQSPELPRLTKVLGGRLLPGNDELASVAVQMDELLVKWLQDDKVYAFHPISRAQVGDILEKRVYVIEDTSGALMLFELAFLKRLGKWYVLRFNVNSKTEALQELLSDD